MNVEYTVGVDIGNAKSKGAIAIAHRCEDGSVEIIGLKRLSGRRWVRNLKFRWHVLVLWFKYYRRVKVVRETNDWR